jgi:prepilin-type N-terminal cleavage/methylation domain-containing protein
MEVVVRSNQGFTLAEILFAVGVASVLSAAAAPQLLAGLDEWRTRGAVRYLSSRLYRARMEAANRNVDTAVRFVAAGSTFEYFTVVDGNRNGVRTADVQTGIDWGIDHPERLADKFAGVEFGALPGLPSVDPSGTAPGADPIRLGSSDMITFTPLGSSSPGSLYVRGRGRVQYVLRMFGETGRIRILRYYPGTREWKQQ